MRLRADDILVGAGGVTLACEHRLEIVPGATHLFEEAGKLEAIAQLARAWFQQHLGAAGRDAPGSAAPGLKFRSRENRRKTALGRGHPIKTH